MTKIELENGKYTVINDNGNLSALRYGEPWRDLTGDNLIYWLVVEIEYLTDEVSRWKSAQKLSPEPLDSPDKDTREAIRNEVLDEVVLKISSWAGGWPIFLQDIEETVEGMKSQPAQPSDCRTEFSDTEMLDFVLENNVRSFADSNGMFVACSMKIEGGKGETPRESIKAAMRAQEKL